MSDTRELIDRYFDLAPRPDADAYFAQFADDAVVEDEGQAHRGIAAIRAWRSKVPRVAYTVHDVKATGMATTRPSTSPGLPGEPRQPDVPFPVRGRRAHHRPHHPPLTRPANRSQPGSLGTPHRRVRIPLPGGLLHRRELRQDGARAANRVISVPTCDDDRSGDGPDASDIEAAR